MKDQFVPYEIAKRMKELGFNEVCLGRFIMDRNKVIFAISKRGISNKFYNEFTIIPGCAAPLWQQAIDWLREKYEIKVIESPKAGYKIWLELDGEWLSELWFDSRQAAIEKALTLIKP